MEEGGKAALYNTAFYKREALQGRSDFKCGFFSVMVSPYYNTKTSLINLKRQVLIFRKQ